MKIIRADWLSGYDHFLNIYIYNIYIYIYIYIHNILYYIGQLMKTYLAIPVL